MNKPARCLYLTGFLKDVSWRQTIGSGTGSLTYTTRSTRLPHLALSGIQFLGT